MKKWQSFSALKRVKNETENLTADLASSLEAVIATPAGEEKELQGLQDPVQAFSIVPGILRLLEFPSLALLANEIHMLLEDTLGRAHVLDINDIEPRLESAFVAVTDLPALFEESLRESTDSFESIFHLLNRLRKCRNCAIVFDGKVLNEKPLVNFRHQFEQKPQKMQDLLMKQAAFFMKSCRALLDNPDNKKAQAGLEGVLGNLELMLRDFRFGTLWGLGRGVFGALGSEESDSDEKEKIIRALAGLGKPLHQAAKGGIEILHGDMAEASIEQLLNHTAGLKGSGESKKGRLHIIGLWYNLDMSASRAQRAEFKTVQIKYFNKSALTSSLQIANEDINSLLDTINVMSEQQDISQEKLEEIHQNIFRLRDVLMFLRMNYLSERITQSLSQEPGDQGISYAAAVLFGVSRELTNKLENMEREVFSTESSLTGVSKLSSARLHVLLNAMKSLEDVMSLFDSYVDNGCRGEDIKPIDTILSDLVRVFTLMPLPEQRQQLETARDYVHRFGRISMLEQVDDSFSSLSHLVINSLWYLEQLSIGREEDSQAFLEKGEGFATLLREYLAGQPPLEAPEDPDDPEGQGGLDEQGKQDSQEEQEDSQGAQESDNPSASELTVLDDASLDIPVLSAEEDQVPVLTEAADDDDFTAAVSQDEDSSAEELTEESTEESPKESSGPDDEIREIFAEEFDEVLDMIRAETASLREDSQQAARIKDCCRYFHTLKGSGRMVGATSIGTLGLAMEKLYDYLGEQQQGMNDEVLSLTDSVIDVLPDLKNDFMNPGQDTVAMETIAQLCREATGFMSAEAAAEVEIPVLQPTAEEAEPVSGEFSVEQMPRKYPPDEAPEEMPPDEVPEEQPPEKIPETPPPDVIPEELPVEEPPAEVPEKGPEKGREQELREHVTEEEDASEAATLSQELVEINSRITAILGGDASPHTTADLEIPLHTLFGIARAQGLENYGAAVHTMEKFQEHFPRQPVTADISAAFQDFCLITDKLVSHVSSGGSIGEYPGMAEDRAALADAVNSLGTSMESAESTGEDIEQSGVSPEDESDNADSIASTEETATDALVIEGFLREARALVPRSQNEADRFWQDPAGISAAGVKQSLHLLQGAAESAELMHVSELSAQMIDSYEKIASGKAEADDFVATVFQTCHEYLADALRQLEGGSQPADCVALSDALTDCLEGPDAGREVPEPPPPVRDPDPESEPVTEPGPEPVPEKEPDPEPVPERDPDPEPEKEKDAGPEETVDQELLAIFLDEADEILETMDALYLRWQKSPDDPGAIDEYLRHLHTLKGNSALVLEKELGKAAHEYETFVIDAQNGGQGFDEAFFVACDDRLHGLHAIYRLYGRDENGQIVRASSPEAGPADAVEPDLMNEEDVRAVPPAAEEAPASGQTAVEGPEDPKEPEEPEEPEASKEAEAPDDAEDAVDQELLAIFLDEADEIMEEMDALFLRWQANPEDAGAIDEYLRYLHTLKGSSALVLEKELSAAVHEYETFVIDTRNRKQGFDSDFFAACDTRLQGLHEFYKLYGKDASGCIIRASSLPVVLETAGEPQDVESPESDISPGNEEVASQPEISPTAQSNETPASSPLEEPSSIDEPVTTAVMSGLAQQPGDIEPPQSPQAAVATETKAIQAAVDEQVRVSSRLLRDLLNDADEINFSRNRIENTFGDIGTLLTDMDETLSRLKSYVKRFEEKARDNYDNAVEERREGEQRRISDEFDSLEMDRYTELQEMSLSLTEDYDDLQDIRMNLGGRLKEIDNVLLGQQRLTNSLQGGLISSQMVPFASIVPRLRRLVRQISRELKKDVEFVVENQQGSLDKNVLQAIITPFEHILRNALDHGIETVEERQQTDKNPQATLGISVSRQGASILIEIRDDGRGINVEKVKQRAIERGLLGEEAEISHDAACQLLFRAGFSTADAVSNISGRGVGLDVVKSEITQIGGTVEVMSETGKGTVFVIQLPLTSSLNRALMFEVQESRYVVLMNTLDGVMVEKLASVHQKLQEEESPVFNYGGQTYEYLYLGKLINQDFNPRLESVDSAISMLLISGRERNFALHVDNIIESRDLVVKSFGKQFASMPGIGGGVIMPDGNVAIVLDLISLLNHLYGDSDTELDAATFQAAPKDEEAQPKTIMVVDDSITVRKVTSTILKRNGLNVITAKNGLEAIEHLELQVPDVILLDIEMPKMDGFEVASHIRKQAPPVRDIPIIMITSRIGEKHRTRAEEIGVNEFMSKPFQEDVLLAHINSY